MNCLQKYPFDKEDIIRRTQLMVEKEKGFHLPVDEHIWKWKMKSDFERETTHWMDTWPDAQIVLTPEQANGLEPTLYRPCLYDLLAWQYHSDNVIGNLEMAPTQIHFKDWEKSTQLINVEPLHFEELGRPVSVNFHQIYEEEIPQEVAKHLPQPIEPEKAITIILERDLIIPPKMHKKWTSAFTLPKVNKNRIFEPNANYLMEQGIIVNNQLLWKNKKLRLVLILINNTSETTILYKGITLGRIENLDSNETMTITNSQELASAFGLSI
jgi:hypothetical protein